jgi:sugar/nucleoside kinase (ribokinase family)
MSVCLVGNFCIDLIIRGVPRMPAWGQEVAGDDYMLASSGQTTYTAFALRALGASVSVVGCVGEDAWGKQIRDDLQARGVDTAGLETIAGDRTALSVAAVRPDGERAFVSDFACLNNADESAIERGWVQVERADIVCLVGVFSWPGLSLARCATLFHRARSSGKATMLDTGWDPGGWDPATLAGLRALLAETTIFMPNEDEARAITGSDEPEQAARRLAALGPELVVVKLGSKGSLALADGNILRQEALPALVVDTVGAGDVFNAGFLYARERGHSLVRCLRFGAATAALYIGRRRDRFPSVEEVLA